MPDAAIPEAILPLPSGAAPCVVVHGPDVSGKHGLMHQWATESPANERWTQLCSGEPTPSDDIPQEVLRLFLLAGCLCCEGELVLQTHLSRTLRLRKPHRLFIELSENGHLESSLRWLQGPRWSSWFFIQTTVLVCRADQLIRGIDMRTRGEEVQWMESLLSNRAIVVSHAGDPPPERLAQALLHVQERFSQQGKAPTPRVVTCDGPAHWPYSHVKAWLTR